MFEGVDLDRSGSIDRAELLNAFKVRSLWCTGSTRPAHAGHVPLLYVQLVMQRLPGVAEVNL